MLTDLSVVIPTSRRPRMLEQALHSVLAQQGVRTEVLVVDDCPDSSAEPVVRRTQDRRVRYIRQPRACGGRPSVLGNMGWPQARGELIHFLEDADIVPDGHYARVKDAFARRRQVGVVLGGMEGFGENDDLVRRVNQRFAEDARAMALAARRGAKVALAARLLFEPHLFVGGAAVVRKQCLVGLGGYNPALEGLEDVELYARLIRRYGAHPLDTVALRYRISSPPHRPGLKERTDSSYLPVRESFRRSFGTLDFYLLKAAARTMHSEAPAEESRAGELSNNALRASW